MLDLLVDLFLGIETRGHQNISDLSLDNVADDLSLLATKEFTSLRYSQLYAIFRMLYNCPEINFKKLLFIDIGAGKGRAAILAYYLGVEEVMGVECAKSLYQACLANREKFVRRFKKRFSSQHLSFHLADACHYHYPEVPALFYLYNPMGSANLHRFIESKILPRKAPTYILLANPLREYVFHLKGSFQVMGKVEHTDMNRRGVLLCWDGTTALREIAAKNTSLDAFLKE